MAQQLGKGKRRASPPSPINFNTPDNSHRTQGTLIPGASAHNTSPGTLTFGAGAGEIISSPPLRSPGMRPPNQTVSGELVACSSSHPPPDPPQEKSHASTGINGTNGREGPRMGVAADPRMSAGNILPWAHIVQVMTEEQQDLEDAEAAEQAEGSIVVDSEEAATDAGYESDNISSGSTTLSSTVRDYSFENGRRYHKFREGRYNFPNDDVEQEREDMKHAMVKMLCQQLHFAPIGKDPQNILDIGTGTGIWAMEMGDQYSSATVLGIDLSPIQPDWVPANVRFMVDDVESAWLHPRNHFDYIHSRHTVMAIKDWPRLFMRSLEHLKPGGWIELQEIHHFPSSADNSMPRDHYVAQYWELINQGLTRLGVDFYAAAGGKLANMMRNCGLVNVTERVFHVPIGIWPKNKVLKTVGLYWRTILLDGIQAIALGPLTRGCNWNKEQVEVFLMNVRRAYHDNLCHMYMPLHIVYGQKPESSGEWY
ncbi:S-adenosyl-L-methionine-dependent methyltransferase [Zalerion maritima]|uniref:S-adenosyl-L-methionine-dependent methyltransferase n=1 Tax=Zalerion maritima TaxID=339359 RepID=A0AAD5RU34_9PEZI|nr:S-adenosyl-L-methionine-dependent methyltransferase [Zalerion maritima]